MKVISKYTIEDCVFIANYLNDQNRVNKSGWVQLYYYFIFANCFAFPAFLFFLNYFLAGILLFLFNLFFILFVGDKVKREGFKSHYRSFFTEGEFQEIEIELFEDGISCKSLDGNTFFQWPNLKKIVETKENIYLFTKGNGIPIPKRSFEFETQMQEFLIFAKARMPQRILKDQSI